MGKWEMVRLGDVAKINMGQSPESSTYNQTGEGIPFYQGNADFGERYPVKRFWCSAPKKLSGKGDVLISVRAPIGAMNFSMETCCIGRGLASITPKSQRLEQNYLWYILKSNYEFLNRQGTGSTFKAINKNILTELLVPFPPLDEQKRIAKNLDLAGEIVKGYKEQLAELDKLVQSVFYEMFGDPVTNEKGWEIKPLQSACDVRDGTHDSPVYVGDGYPLVTSKNVSQGFIDFSTANLISQEDLIKINQRSKVDNGDIIMPMIGTIGNPVIVSVDREFAVKNVAIIKFGGSSMCNMFIKTLLCSSFFERAIQKSNRGGTQKFIALGDIRKLSIPVPPSDIQTCFASIVAEIEAQKAQIQQALTEAENLFNSLMQEYFE